MRIIRYTVNFIELPVDLINNSRVLSKKLRRYTSPRLLIPDDHSYTIEIASAHSSYIRLQRKMTGVFFAVVDSFEIQRARRLSFFKLPCARTRICFFDLLLLVWLCVFQIQSFVVWFTSNKLGFIFPYVKLILDITYSMNRILFCVDIYNRFKVD